MKLLLTIHSLNPAGGGPSEVLRRLTAVLKELGHEPELLCVDAPGTSWLKDFTIKVHALGPGKGGYGYSPRLLTWLEHNYHNYDIVTVHGLWQYHGCAVRRVLEAGNKPYFVYPHGMLDPWFKKRYPLKHLKKWIYWLLAEHRVLRDAAAVMFTCEEERRLASHSFWPYRCNEAVISYGTAAPGGDSQSQKAAFLERYPHLQNTRILLFLGRLHEKKGLDILIKAFARFVGSNPQLHLVIAGPDSGDGLLNKLKTLASQELGAQAESHVTWTGMLRGDLKWGAFYAADAFILPSHQENFGIAVAEAMATGTPVLISNKVNIWREIQNDGAGYVAEDTFDGGTELIGKFLATDTAQCREMSENARISFARRFEINAAVNSMVKVFNSFVTPS